MKTNTTSPGPEQQPLDFRGFLQAELARRCLENPQYSLRAFAGRIGLDHSTLSQILRGRRTVTERTIRKAGALLELQPQAIDEFVELQNARFEPPERREVRRLTGDMVRIVSEWHHYAILELTHLRDFVPDSRWIARVLDLSVDEVNAAVSRLASLRLLAMEAPDRWVDLSGPTAASLEDFTRLAVEQWAAQLRERSLAALDELPASHRQLSSTTVAIDTPPPARGQAAHRTLRPRTHFGAGARPGPRRRLPARHPSVSPDQPEPRLMSHPVIRWQILATDPEKSEAFYTRLFDWKVDADNPLGYRMIDTGSPRGIGGGIWPAPEAPQSFVQLFVAVDDVDAYCAKAEELGGRVIIPKQVLPEGDEMAVLLDPQGMAVGIAKEAG